MEIEITNKVKKSIKGSWPKNTWEVKTSKKSPLFHAMVLML
jgi:hypothetical protein